MDNQDDTKLAGDLKTVRCLIFLFGIWSLGLGLCTSPAPAATVVGSLQDISQQGLNTKLTFSPTTNVLLTPNGLSAGPPKSIDAVTGQFSVVLEAGDYVVSLPLV